MEICQGPARQSSRVWSRLQTPIHPRTAFGSPLVPPGDLLRPWTGGPHLRRRTFSCWDSNQENSCQDCCFSQQRFFVARLHLSFELQEIWIAALGAGLPCSLDTSNNVSPFRRHHPNYLFRTHTEWAGPAISVINRVLVLRAIYFLVPAQTVHLANPANSVFCHPSTISHPVFRLRLSCHTSIATGLFSCWGDRVCIPQYLLCLAILF